MENVRLARLLHLMIAVRARVAPQLKDLVRELEVSDRTVQRDLQALRMAGVPCWHDAEAGGYRIAGDFFLPPVQLTLREAMALSVLGAEVARNRQLPFVQDAWRAVTKIRSQLPASIREEVADADRHVRVQTARVSPQEGCEEHFQTLRRAIRQTRKVRCTYEGGRKKSKSFLLRPYALFFCQRAWYVIGHSEARGAERSLKLNRLTEAVVTDIHYMIPDGWTLEKSLGNAWRMIRGSRRYHVIVDFDEEFGRSMADTLWHPTQTIAWPPGGGCRFECDVDGLDEIVWWILGYGPHARVIALPELSHRMRELAGQTAKHYASSNGCRG